ncbi:MAG TPA: two-component regulator propeller domain-containing protein [Bacteroidia bacterium]|nr:two-component regulator propeller domain-containing protein [Bacteroidia bacterium]
MRTCKRCFSGLFLFVILLSITATGQTLPVGGWKVHLPFKSCKYVTGSTSSIWAATENGLFRLNKVDNSLDRITKVEGLSDLQISALGHNPYNNILLVGYQNGNLDLITGNVVVNLNDIKRSQIIANKTIYNFFFAGPIAYVSTGFGIVVIDTDRNEVKDTYLIGANGAYMQVFDMTSDGTTLFAATENGIHYAPINDPYLSNFATWSAFSNLPNNQGNFGNVELFDGKLFTIYNHTFPALTYNRDTLFSYDFATTSWTRFDTVRNDNFHDMYVRNGAMYISGGYNIYKIVPGYTVALTYNGLDNQTFPLFPDHIFVDETNAVWEADDKYGLVKAVDFLEGYSFYPNGPVSTGSYWMDIRDSRLLVVPGGHDVAWGNTDPLIHDGPSVYDKGIWFPYPANTIPGMDTVYDVLSCSIDPENPQHFFVASWGDALVEIENEVIVNAWNPSNSTLQTKPGDPNWCGVGGIQFDEEHNLWMTNSHVVTSLNVLKADGTWQAFDFTGIIPSETYIGELMVTSTGQKWILLPRGGQGFVVFDDNGTLANTSDDKKKRVLFDPGNGDLPGTEVFCMVEDHDGEIWVGTDKGIGVFYCVENIFTTDGCDAQQILITQDGHVQILLENQIVSALAVDGANRKWIGTESGGVFLMSEDGTKELAHFDTRNSPLLSDNILSIAIDQKTGEVFFGTEKGIVSYRGEAIEGAEEMGDVYAFPNPVRPEYRGPIAITGLVKDADVKIADVRGNLVFETKSLGGQAIWDGNNFQGERVASGVYIVLISNEDGSQKTATKILLLN